MPKKSPESLLAIFSSHADATGESTPVSEESLEELGTEDLVDDEESGFVAAAKPLSVEPKKLAQILGPKIVEAPAIKEAEPADSGEATLVVDRSEMGPAAAKPAVERSEPVADRTMRMPRSDVFEAAAVVAKADAAAAVPPAPTTAPVLPAPSPTPAPVSVRMAAAAPRPQHGSIAPVALDVQPPRAHAPSVPAYVLPTNKPPTAAIAIGAVALVLVAGAVIAGITLGRSSFSSSSTASSERASQPSSDSSKSTASAPAAADDSKDSMPVFDPDDLPTSDAKASPVAPPAKRAAASGGGAARPASAPAPRAQSDKPASASPAAPAQPAAVAPAQPAAPAAGGNRQTMGVIRVPESDSIVTIRVDGSYRRVKNGAVVVACGHRKVQVGIKIKEVEVPCGGSVFVD